MDNISQTVLSNVFSSKKMFDFRLEFHWSLFLRVQLTLFQYRFRLWHDAVQATRHYLNQLWLVYQRMYASLGLNGLSCMTKTIITVTLQWTRWRLKSLAFRLFTQPLLRRRSSKISKTPRQWPVNFPHKWPVTRKMFPFDDVIMMTDGDLMTQSLVQDVRNNSIGQFLPQHSGFCARCTTAQYLSTI